MGHIFQSKTWNLPKFILILSKSVYSRLHVQSINQISHLHVRCTCPARYESNFSSLCFLSVTLFVCVSCFYDYMQFWSIHCTFQRNEIISQRQFHIKVDQINLELISYGYKWSFLKILIKFPIHWKMMRIHRLVKSMMRDYVYFEKPQI